MIYIWVFWYILHVFRRQLSSLKPFWIQMFLIWRKIVWKASRVPDLSTSRILELVEVNKIFQISRRNLDFAKLTERLAEFSLNTQYVRSIRIRSYLGSHFPAFGLNIPYLSVLSLNAGKYGPEWLRIRTLFASDRKTHS